MVATMWSSLFAYIRSGNESRPFYELYDDSEERRWFREFWKVSMIIALVYFLAIQVGVLVMRNRKAFELRGPLFIWNLFLVNFSIYGAWYQVPRILAVYNRDGFYAAFCHPWEKGDQLQELLMCLFVWSKVLELGDTAFIILRKGRLQKIHWVHHMATLVHCFYSYKNVEGTHSGASTMNYFVHSIMYGYYSLRSLKVPVHRSVAIVITAVQILQMIIGTWVHFKSLPWFSNGECDVSFEAALAGFIFYISLFVIFCDFFKNSYFPATRDRLLSGKAKKS